MGRHLLSRAFKDNNNNNNNNNNNSSSSSNDDGEARPRTSSSDADQTDRTKTDPSSAYYATSSGLRSSQTNSLERILSDSIPGPAAPFEVLVTYKASCVRKSRRHCSPVNVGQIFLTPDALLFHSDFMTLLPEDSNLNFSLTDISNVRRASYKRLLPHGISVRCKLSQPNGRNKSRDFLFAFETRRQQLTFLHALELAMFDVADSRTSENDASCDGDLDTQTRRNHRFRSKFLPSRERHSSSSDSRASTIDLPQHVTPCDYSSEHEPISLPSRRVTLTSSLSKSLTPSIPHDHPNQCDAQSPTPTPEPSTHIKRSQSHPGHSSSASLHDISFSLNHPSIFNVVTSGSLTSSLCNKGKAVLAPIVNGSARVISSKSYSALKRLPQPFTATETTPEATPASATATASASVSASTPGSTSASTSELTPEPALKPTDAEGLASQILSRLPFTVRSLSTCFQQCDSLETITLFSTSLILLLVLLVTTVSISQLHTRVLLLDSLVSSRIQ